jgi:hypothetical protein
MWIVDRMSVACTTRCCSSAGVSEDRWKPRGRDHKAM